MIIDAHCHVWPDHIAPRVLAGRPSGMDSMHDGTVAGLLRTMDAAGVDRGCALGVAHIPANVDRTNEFIGSLDRSRFTPFGTVHPALPIEENLASLDRWGIHGVKLHPLFQELSLADPAVVDLVAALADSNVTVLTHVGAGGDEAANERGRPQALRALIDAVPNVNVIACHFGGYHRLDEAMESLVGTRVTLETSWPPRLADLERERVLDLISRHGADRVVFGSDWPMADPAAEIRAIRGIGLVDEDLDVILGGNLAAILGLS